MTRRSSENTTAHASNDKQLCGKSQRSIRPCPEWGFWLRGIVGARAWGVCGVLFPVILQVIAMVWGGSTPGPLNPSLEGRLDPFGSFPGSDWVGSS